MAEAKVNMDHENKIVGEEEEEEIREENSNSDSNTSMEANTSHLLAGLNLVFILSFLSLSPEECSDLEEIKEREVQINNHKVNHVVSRSNVVTRKRESNEFRGVERQTSKDHTKIRDCRHCRRM